MKPKTIRKCIVCDKLFQSLIPHAKYCSLECAGLKRVKKAPKKKPKKTFDEIVKESDACGMSYGKYKVALQSGKTFEELKAEYEIQKQALEDRDSWNS